MENLLFAIIMALNSLLPASGSLSNYPDDNAKLEKAKYILENNLYKVDDGGVIIDPNVSL